MANERSLTATGKPAAAGARWLAKASGWIGRYLFALFWAFLLIIPALSAATILGGRQGTAAMIAIGFWFLATLLHELGHATAAWALGWDVHVIGVSRLNFLPRQRRFRSLPEYARWRYGGFVLATPSTLAQWNGRGYLLFAMGGPLANFAVAAIGIGAVTLLDPAMSSWAVLMACFGVSSFLYGVLNLLPVRWDSGRRSDGARLIDYLRRRRKPPLAYARARMSGLRHDGVPPRRWDPSLAQRILSDDKDPDWLMVAAYAFVSSGRTLQALAAVRAALAVKPDFVVEAPAIVAFLIALTEHDAMQAREWLAKCGDESTYDFAGWRALAVVLAIEHRWGDARAAVAQARKAAVEAAPDADDEAVLTAIEQGREPPVSFADAAA